jgi:hypothetical protein
VTAPIAVLLPSFSISDPIIRYRAAVGAWNYGHWHCGLSLARGTSLRWWQVRRVVERSNFLYPRRIGYIGYSAMFLSLFFRMMDISEYHKNNRGIRNKCMLV